MSIFSDISSSEYIFDSKYFFAIYDRYPVSPGHLLLISKKVKETYFDLEEDERKELSDLILKAKNAIELKYSPDGFNIGMNCGEAAGQTVMHFHCHVIPRYISDMADPRGGIRHCVYGKGYYITK